MLSSLLARKGSRDALLLGSFCLGRRDALHASSIAPMKHWIRNVTPLAFIYSGVPAAIEDIPRQLSRSIGNARPAQQKWGLSKLTVLKSFFQKFSPNLALTPFLTKLPVPPPRIAA